MSGKISLESFQRFALEVLKSKTTNWGEIAKILPRYKDWGSHPAYGKIKAQIKDYIKASNTSRGSGPQEKRQVTLALNSWFFMSFRWFLYEINDEKTDRQRTGIAVLRDNSTLHPVYANGTANEYVMYYSMGFDVQTGLAGAVGLANPGPTESLSIEYNPNDGTDPDLQKVSAGARFNFMEPWKFPGIPSYPGAGLFMRVNQFIMASLVLPHTSHPAWEKQSSVPSINRISSFPYDPWNIKTWFMEPGWIINQQYVDAYMEIPPEIAIPSNLPDGYRPSNPFVFDPNYWTAYASDAMSIQISETEYEPLKDILFTVDPYDHDWTSEEVIDWYKNANNNFFGTCIGTGNPGNINYVLYRKMIDFTTSWLAGKEKTSLEDIRKYIYGIGGGITKPFWLDSTGNIIWKRYLIPESIIAPHASKYSGILYPQCEVYVLLGCDGVCYS